MIPLTAFLLLALGAPTNAESRFPGATTVVQYMFDSSRDDEIYGWPQGWSRHVGPGFPRYVRVRVHEDQPPPGGSSMRVELDGGAAAAYSPAVPVNPDVQFVLEGYVQTSQLQYDAAYLSLIYLDSARAKLGSVSSEKIGGTSSWRRICIGPVSPPAGAASLLIGLTVEPLGEMQDRRGTAAFGALWLGQLPRVVLTAQPAKGFTSEQGKASRDSSDKSHPPRPTANDTAFLLFPKGQPIEIACVVTGFASPAYEVRMQLLDSDGHELSEKRQRFDAAPISPRPPTLPTSAASRFPPSPGEGQGVANSPRLFAGEGGRHVPMVGVRAHPSSNAQMTWRLPADALGFYRVRAKVVPIASSVPSPPPVAAPAPQAELSLAVIEPQTLPPDSEFGWSLGPHDADVGLVPLADLLGQSGIRRVKFPFAIQETEALAVSDSKSQNTTSKSLEPLISFSDRLAMAGIGLMGVLQPPGIAGDSGKSGHDLLAAEAFARDPKTWFPSVEPVLARLATQIRFWQIGNDRDPGWVGCRDVAGIVSRTKAVMDHIGQDLDMGIPWELSAPLPIVAAPSSHAVRSGKAKTIPVASVNAPPPKAPWSFLSVPCDKSPGKDGMSRFLDSTKSAGIARWIVLDALPREGHAARERIGDLVESMLTAKIHGAEGIFVSGPLDPNRGLVTSDGYPSELFLPWRTTALRLGGAPYVGDIDLPQGNRIQCFGGRQKYVGVLAGPRPVQETVYLGNDLQTQDLWGNIRACPPTISGDDSVRGLSPAPRSVIAVEQLPNFLVGLDGPVTQWQLGVGFSPKQLPSVPSAIVPARLELKNTFPQAISGHISIRAPENWHMEPRTAEFRLEVGAAWRQDLQVALPNDVTGGRQMVRLDFEIQADRLYRFAMVRPLEITLGDVEFAGHATLDKHGEMEVRQTLINRGASAAGFRCDLLVPDRRRQSTEVFLQPSGKSELTYHLPDGEQLRGKTIWLRAEEIDGPRVLNYRIDTLSADAH